MSSSRSVGSASVGSALFAGGLVAGYVLADSHSRDSLLDPMARYDAFSTVVNGTVLAAIVAVVTAMILAAISRPRRVEFLIAVIALVVLGVGALGTVPTGFAQWSTPVAAGALLGALATLSGGVRARHITLAVGVLTAAVLGNRLDDILRVTSLASADFGWTAVDSANTVPAGRSVVIVTVVAITLAVLVGAWTLGPTLVDTAQRVDGRTVVVGVGLPIVGAIVSWAVTTVPNRSWVWFVGAAAMTVAVWIAAHGLRGRDGTLILALFAAWTAGMSGSLWLTDSAAVLIVSAALLVLGAVAGWRWARAGIGMGALAVVAASALAGHAGFAGVADTVQFVGWPLAAGYTVAAALTPSVTGSAVALGSAFTLTIPLTVFAVGAGSTTIAFVRGGSDPGPLAVASTVVVMIAVCAYGLRSLRIRPDTTAPTASSP